MVEAQHRVSTLKLVDTLEEQSALERLIESSKPVLPLKCRHLDYLLATPFRYGALYPKGSRFRRAGITPGVFYASDTARTAVAETVFWRLMLFAESPDTPWPQNILEHTGFSVAYASGRAIDLTSGVLAKRRAEWIDVANYEPCQQLAEQARSAGIDLIRYESVRDPQAGKNVALLSCEVFAKPAPLERQSWRIRLSANGAQALCEFPSAAVEFTRDSFAVDPRIAKMRWDRA